MRLLLPLALAAAVSAPAHAVSPTFVCTAALTDAAAGTTSSCATSGPGPLGNKDVAVRRTATIVVAHGAVDATLDCGSSSTGTVHVTTTTSLNAWDSACLVTITATTGDTTAVATSTFSFVYIGAA
jgi:hypothetical protein